MKNRVTILLLVLFASISAGTWYIFKEALSVRASREGTEPRMGSRQIAQFRRRTAPVEVVYFTLYYAAIYPSEQRVDKGFVAIAVEDMSGGTAGLVVNRNNSELLELVGNVVPSENTWRGMQEFFLLPGRYQISDASRPTNRAVLIVEP